MNYKRYMAITDEMVANPAAFQKDGYKYFMEAMPVIESVVLKQHAAALTVMAAEEADKKAAEKKVVKKVEKAKTVPKVYTKAPKVTKKKRGRR